MKYISGIIICCVILIFLNAPHAAEKKNVDVVLVMDSTGSMKKTDPSSLRIPAAKMFISLLDMHDRAGMISFSENASVLVTLTPLDSEDNKTALLAATDMINSAGLHTNIYEALHKGLDVLSGSDMPGKEKIVVLMSDGMMDTGDPEKDQELIGKLKDELTQGLVSGGVKVYSLAFTEGSDRELLEKISKITGGFYNLALTDKDLHVVFSSIFESLKTPDMLPMSDNSFLVDGSVREVTIVASKGSVETTIQIQAPDGSRHSAKNKMPGSEWFTSANFDMVTIKDPAAGKWDILFSSGKNNKAYVITNLSLMTNFSEQYPIFGQTLDIRVWLEKDGKPLREKEVLEKISVHLELTNPDGETVRLEPFDKGEGIVERKIELYTAGNYKLRIMADGKTFQREKTFPFKVSDLKESQEDVRMRRETKTGTKKDEAPPESKPAGNGEDDSISWGKVIVQFVTINLVLGIIALAYFRMGPVRDFIKAKLKRKNPDD